MARDLGRMLGCHAHVSALRRVASGPFSLSEAVDGAVLADLDEGALAAALKPVATGLADLAAVAVTAAEAAALRHGRAVARSPLPEGSAGWAADPDGLPVALIAVQRGAIYPTRVIAPRRDGA